MQDPYVVVTAANSPLARRRPAASDLDGLPMVGHQRGKQQDRAEEFLLGRGVRPRVVFRSNDNGTVQAMVAADLDSRWRLCSRWMKPTLASACCSLPSRGRRGC